MSFFLLARFPKHQFSVAQFLRHTSHTSFCRHFSLADEKVSHFEAALEKVESTSLYGLPKLDKTIEDLASMYQKGKLNLFPEYQRDYVWGKNDSKHSRASRLVVTVLCSRFIPPVVIHEREKGNFDVVDGKQRLCSLLAFYYGETPTVSSPVPSFTELNGLKEEYEELNGLSFSNLVKSRQDAFESYSLTIMNLKAGTPADDVFDVYQDINSGGTSLTAQQIRRAAFYGDYIKKLDELVKNETFLQIVGVSQPDPSEAHQELILRAMAFRSFQDFKPPLKRFLNEELAKLGKLEQNLQQKKLSESGKQFLQVMKVAKEVFTATKAFRTHKNNIDKALWDVKYCALSSILFDNKVSALQLQQHTDLINENFKKLLEDDQFIKDLKKSKTVVSFERSYQKIKSCFLECFSQDQKGPRYFERASLMEKLYDKQKGKCAICGTRLDLDNAAVDHIVPWARGGKTVTSNAQLTHPRCNSSKGSR